MNAARSASSQAFCERGRGQLAMDLEVGWLDSEADWYHSLRCARLELYDVATSVRLVQGYNFTLGECGHGWEVSSRGRVMGRPGWKGRITAGMVGGLTWQPLSSGLASRPCNTTRAPINVERGEPSGADGGGLSGAEAAWLSMASKSIKSVLPSCSQCCRLLALATRTT